MATEVASLHLPCLAHVCKTLQEQVWLERDTAAILLFAPVGDSGILGKSSREQIQVQPQLQGLDSLERSPG